MASIIGIFRKGEDIAVALDALAGDPADVAEITAVMRKVRLAGSAVVLDRGDPIPMTITVREAQGACHGGWTLLVPADVSRDLPAGTYGIDARLAIGSGIEITDDTAVIQLGEGMLS